MMEDSQTTNLVGKIEDCLRNIGIMYRIFHRRKTAESLKRKIDANPEKYGTDKKIQDIFGVRIALYFIDDIDVVIAALEKKFSYVKEDSMIDDLSSETFKAVRCNLIFKMPDGLDFTVDVDDQYKGLIDSTFEIQIRTILSEGWHEIDHDLRYKCKEDWIGLSKENRALNGVYATLETSEWTILKLFEQLSYLHYKNNNIAAMINNKFRLRMTRTKADLKVVEFLQGKPDFRKKIYRYSREKMLNFLSDRKRIPISLSLVVFIVNNDLMKDVELNELMPDIYKKWWGVVVDR